MNVCLVCGNGDGDVGGGVWQEDGYKLYLLVISIMKSLKPDTNITTI